MGKGKRKRENIELANKKLKRPKREALKDKAGQG
jgi:hypothetical protein